MLWGNPKKRVVLVESIAEWLQIFILVSVPIYGTLELSRSYIIYM